MPCIWARWTLGIRQIPLKKQAEGKSRSSRDMAFVLEVSPLVIALVFQLHQYYLLWALKHVSNTYLLGIWSAIHHSLVNQCNPASLPHLMLLEVTLHGRRPNFMNNLYHKHELIFFFPTAQPCKQPRKPLNPKIPELPKALN